MVSAISGLLDSLARSSKPQRQRAKTIQDGVPRYNHPDFPLAATCRCIRGISYVVRYVKAAYHSSNWKVLRREPSISGQPSRARFEFAVYKRGAVFPFFPSSSASCSLFSSPAHNTKFLRRRSFLRLALPLFSSLP